ncbi:DUF4263 domain-containing protein [Sedimentibacter hydroxybenzoicus DSM 7310]|uniref:DUF4263 domain-containing protein n=1 Tax=Sedimentibacter hydroxybenzoicus DSM 7310 TaxID=1123245 RepID=A0A974GVI2_SEDHY|nr:Shedu immune nuclease family protein [Sedimentibacter hydroxybenzoicus]NYB73417.1 DUF4263 domain-containing protein [Sedimentibacter hydroxybenzoicus DSM 7310]
MKISDFIFEFPTHSRYPGLCRVRIFVSSEGNIVSVLTDIGDKNPSSSVTNSIESICQSLIQKGLVTDSTLFIEHYEDDVFDLSHTFDIIEFNSGCPQWHSVGFKKVKILLSCDDEEFLCLTKDNVRLQKEIDLKRHAIDPYMDFPYEEDPIIIKRRIEIEDGKISKESLKQLVDSKANEHELQEKLKTDLSVIGETYAYFQNEYICFSEFPIGERKVDFVVFTGRSRMEVVLIEVKGADFSLVNQNNYANFSSKLEEAASQLRSHWNYIHRNYEYFRRYVHELRLTIERGGLKYNAFLGASPRLSVDSNKDIIIRNVIICGRSVDDLEESKKRHEYESNSQMSLKLETWDSLLFKIRR